jgi:hypothetical protein
MHSYLALGLWKRAAVGIAVFLATTTAHAQTDEIQVYDAEINNPGQFSLQLHNNYTPIGRKEPDFPGGIVPNHTLNGVLEWAYGVVDWLELGAYMPVYSWTGSGQRLIDGAKLRAEFVVPHAAERAFFYGVNFELSFNAHYWEPTRNSGEIRPIIGGRIGPIDLITNPIVDQRFAARGMSQAVIADLVKAGRQDVLEEAPDELVAGDGFLTLAVGGGPCSDRSRSRRRRPGCGCW